MTLLLWCGDLKVRVNPLSTSAGRTLLVGAGFSCEALAFVLKFIE
jgi:hypothetical protein